MKHRLIYISALAAVVLASCTKEREITLSGTGEKTPITVVSNLSMPSPVTRAVDDKFEVNELLNAYIKHVTVSNPAANPLVWAADVTGTGVGPRLANFKVSALTTDHENDADNWTDHSATSALTVTDAEGLYWDDFSNSIDADHDLRTSGHALMVYYGYGFNGGTATTALTQSTGVLGWTVAIDQTSGFKTSDLLYAGQQIPVAYAHGSNNTITGRDRVLTVPYTHAMSKVTIEVVCDEGFDEDATKNFGSAAVKLYQAGTVATVTGPTKAVAKGTSPADINMQKLTPVQAKQCSFSALMAPTLVKAGEPFATISGIDGNNYTITLTDAAIDEQDGVVTKATAWSTQLAAYNAASVTPDAVKAYTAEDGGLTKPGVHYMLTVTIKKQQIKVEATIREWDAVSATGIGQILFDSDITDKTGDIADGLKASGFDLYKSSTTTFGGKTSTVSWQTDKWVYNPIIYWQKSSDASYFRALSGNSGSLDLSQGTDVLWGTTAEHSGIDVNGNAYNYARSAQIAPRTGNVPLEFEHAMSKVSFILKNADDIEDAAKVNLDGARISIINLYNGGTIDVNTGDISNLTLTLTPPQIYTLDQPVDGEHKLLNQVVIPQSLIQNKEGASRDTAPSYYQSNELTAIYSTANPAYETVAPGETANTSIGTGEATYYQTSDLTPVPVALFDAEGANTYNGSLSGARHAGYEEKYTEEEVIEYNSKLQGAVKEGDPKPAPEEGTYTAEEAASFNAKLPGAVSTGTTKKTYTQDDANAYNATLPGAVKVGDVKVPAHYKLPLPAPASHNAGDLKQAGNKIMLYVTLADGTRYGIDLATCEDTSHETITKWLRGKHYTYTISLQKEQITFRALIKDWVETSGGGNANLEWD